MNYIFYELLVMPFYLVIYILDNNPAVYELCMFRNFVFVFI